MEVNKRLISYVSICYLIISILLFSIFIYSYRFYFYKNQKQTQIIHAEAREELILKSIVEKFKAKHEKRELEQKLHMDFLKKAAKSKLQIITESLNAISDSNTKKAEEPIADDIGDPDFIFVDVPEVDKALDKMIKPLNKKDSEGKFIKHFNDLTLNVLDGLRVQRIVKGEYAKPIPISYINLGEKKLALYNDGFEYNWTVRIFGKVKSIKNIDYESLENEIAAMYPNGSKRLKIFYSSNETPVLHGENSDIDFKRIKAIWSKSEELVTMTYISHQTEEKVIYNDQEMLKIRLYSFLIDPETNLTLTLALDILENAWTQFSFFRRNIVPISVFVILAWVICPILAFFAFKMAHKFQFTFTADLEENRTASDYQEEESQIKKGHTDSFFTTPIPDWEDSSDEEVNHESAQLTQKRQTVTDTLTQSAPSSLSKNEKTIENQYFNTKISPFSQFNDEELQHIRMNNIKKTQGMFTVKDAETDIDYLEGVQSDVLRSLISKLREEG